LSTVFVVNRSCHDFSPAEKYGKLFFVTEGSVGKFNTSVMYRAAKRACAKATAADYILITGQSIMSSIICSVFAVKFKRLNLLLYCGSEERYKVRRIILHEQ
jgi:hypothetical protein